MSLYNRPIRRYWNQHNPRIDGQKVRQLRLDAGMTQQHLAEAIGVSERTIRIWETEEGPMRDAGRTADKLARVLGVERAQLFVKRETASRCGSPRHDTPRLRTRP